MPKIADAYVEVREDASKLRVGLKRSERSIKTFAARSARWLAPLRKSFARLGSIIRSNLRRATVAFAGLVAGMILAVRAAAKQEAAEEQLAASLERLGASVDKQMRRFKQFASAIQVATGIADEEFLPSLALGANLAEIHGKQLEKLSIAAIGLSKVIGVDVKTSMMLLARAVKGQFQLFSRYGIALDENASAQENFDSIMRSAISGFPLATAEMETTAGAMRDLKNATGDLMEEIGNLISQRGGIRGMLGDLADLARGTQELMKLRRRQPEAGGGEGGGIMGALGAMWRFGLLGRVQTELEDIAELNRQSGAEMARWDKVRLELTRKRLENEQIIVNVAKDGLTIQERAAKLEARRQREESKFAQTLARHRETMARLAGRMVEVQRGGEFGRRGLQAQLLGLQERPFAAQRMEAETAAQRRDAQAAKTLEAQLLRLGQLQRGGRFTTVQAAAMEEQLRGRSRENAALSKKVLQAQLAAIEKDRIEAAKPDLTAILTRQRGAAFTGGLAGLVGAVTAPRLDPLRESITVQKDMLGQLEQIRKGVFAFSAVGNN